MYICYHILLSILSKRFNLVPFNKSFVSATSYRQNINSAMKIGGL